MKLDELLYDEIQECEIVFVDKFGNVLVDDDGVPLTEGAIRAFKRIGTEIKRQYRCTTGPKKGRIVASPQACATRKDPRKVRHGKKVARMRKGIRVRKSSITKRKSVSKMAARMNQRIMGKTPAKSDLPSPPSS